MRKFKVQFTKDRKGQTYFERSLTLDALNVLLVVSDEVQVEKTKKKTGSIVFILHKPGLNLFAKVINVPTWVLKQFLPEKEWRKL